MGDAGDGPEIHRLRQGGGTELGDRGRCWLSSAGTTTTPTGSSSSLFSSTSSSLTDDDDDATSSCSPPIRRPVSSSSSTSSLTTTSSDKMQTTMDDGATAGAGPLYELSTMLDHLPSLRTGLSKYYRGRSQSFVKSLADVSCVEDLAKKKAAPRHIRRTKAPSRCYAAAALGAKNQLSKKIAKKMPTDSLLYHCRN